MEPWDQPLDVRIASAQAFWLSHVEELRGGMKVHRNCGLAVTEESREPLRYRCHEHGLVTWDQVTHAEPKTEDRSSPAATQQDRLV